MVAVKVYRGELEHGEDDDDSDGNSENELLYEEGHKGVNRNGRQ